VGDWVSVTFLSCTPQHTQQVYLSETTPECKEFRLSVYVPPARVKVCRTTTLQATVKDDAGHKWTVPLKWKSETPDIATVPNPTEGVVKGVSEGPATITVKVPGMTPPYTISVSVEPLVMIVKPGAVTLEPGQNAVLEAVDESGKPYDEPVSWQSSSPRVASVVSVDSKTVLVTAGSPPTTSSATITATSTITNTGTVCTASGSATVRVNAAVNTPLAIVTSSLPGGTVNENYSLTLTATGGTTPYSWSVVSGSVPPGLNLSTEGVLNGSLTSGGTYNFTVQVNDANSQVATKSLTVTIVDQSKFYRIEWSMNYGWTMPYSSSKNFPDGSYEHFESEDIRKSRSSGAVVVRFPGPGVNPAEIQIADLVLNTSLLEVHLFEQSISSHRVYSLSTRWYSQHDHPIASDFLSESYYVRKNDGALQSVFEEFLVGATSSGNPSLTIDYAKNVIQWWPIIPLAPGIYGSSITITNFNFDKYGRQIPIDYHDKDYAGPDPYHEETLAGIYYLVPVST
jgi:hypothetical protein